MSDASFNRELARLDITPKMIADALARPGSFGLSSHAPHAEEMFSTWSLGPVIETRDSDILGKANAEALRRHLRTMPEIADDWCETECSHWAVGHVTHLSFRVLTKRGQPTKIFRVILAWQNMLSEYPVADESLYSTMEYEAADDAWCSYQARDVRRDIVKILVGRGMSDDAAEALADTCDDATLWRHAMDDNAELYDGALRLDARLIERLATLIATPKASV